MAIDIDSMAPDAREHYLGIGRRYVTAHVLEQGEKTLRGVAKHRPALAEEGFGPDDEQDLADAIEALRAQDTDRAQASSLRKILAQACTDEVRNAKQWRKRARAILNAGLRILRQAGDAASIRLVETVLKETKILGGEENLAKQMEMLQAVLSNPAVINVVITRGGARALSSYQDVRSALITAQGDRAAQPAVTGAAERRDILDGIVVTLARSARTAARLAARTLGQPSIAADLALTHLKRSRTDASGTDEPEAPQDPATPDEPGIEPPVAA